MTDSSESRREFIKASLALSSAAAIGAAWEIASDAAAQPLAHPALPAVEGPRPIVERFHPVFDFERWAREFPLSSFERKDGPRRYKSNNRVDLWKAAGRRVGSPSDLACIEQIRMAAARDRDLGRKIPVDVFVWELDELSPTYRPKTPWLTRIGGAPWRAASDQWPVNKEGHPLGFLAQISFVDSMGLFSEPLPGDVLLIFADFDQSELWDGSSVHTEWVSRDIETPIAGLDCPHRTLMPMIFNGVIHRTNNFPDSTKVFDELGHDRSFYIDEIQATSIGTRASLPQGWPFEDGDGNELLAVLSDFIPSRTWPFVNMESLPSRFTKPNEISQPIEGVFRLGIADAGCLYIYRDKTGQIHHAMTSM